MIKAFMINEKKPNVRMVIGNENSDKMGFTKRLSNPNTIAKIMTAVKLVTSTCGPSNFDIPKAATAVMRSLIMVFILLFFRFSGFYFYFFYFGNEPIF